MEGLEKLEQVQRAIELLHSVGIYDSNPDSERFLANFTSLLMEQCGEIDVSAKCELISKHISKISSLCFGSALQREMEDCSQPEIAAQLHYDDETNSDSSQYSCDDAAMIGMDAMIRSNSTLEDFCRSYFIFHKMDASQPQSVFKYLPMLSFTESYIYQLDGLNEKLLQLPNGGSSVWSRKFEVQNSIENYFKFPTLISGFLSFLREVQVDDPTLDAKSRRTFEKDPFRPLAVVLESQGLLTARITEELRLGEEYWALERKLCCALECNKEISIEDVKRAIHLKSFDYRVLNHLLYQLRGEKVNELHMEFLSISELLVEVSDDLFDYEDDVVENNFNVLRMFAKYYGASAAPIMLAKFITEAEEKYDQLLKALGPELSEKYQKRCEEATREGGKTCGPSLGSWHVPQVIEDETAYRTRLLSTSSP